MAAPNIVGITTIIGRTTSTSLTTTNPTLLLANNANSNKVFKINNIIVANTDGTNPADITVSLNSNASGTGTNIRLAFTITVNQDSTLVVIDKASSFYLEEDRSIVVQASVASRLDVVCSYEDIS